MSGVLDIAVDDRGVARLRMMRPERHNALDTALIDALAAAAARMRADGDVRVVVLEAEGKSFCAGGDLGWMQAQMGADAQTRRAEAFRLAHMLRDLNALPQPLIARVQGAAYGGGVGLACVSDVVIAAEGAGFGLTETRLGLIPATIGPYVLARIGQGAARRYFASSERFGAEVAARLGIVSEVVAAADLGARVDAMVETYLACAPGAVAAAKALALRDAPGAEVIAASVEALVARWEGQEALDGTTAFFDRRPPPWSVG